MSNEVVLKDENIDYNLQAFVELTLFNCELKGIYSSKETTTETQKSILVMPTSPKSNEFSIEDFLIEANNLIKSFSGVNIDVVAVTAKLKEFGLDLKNIKIEIKQLFLYMDKTTKIPKSESDDSTKKLEYAFNLVITNNVETPADLQIFRITRFGIAIYKTNRKFVIDKMELEDIDSLI